jgi:hypothetical protein
MPGLKIQKYVILSFPALPALFLGTQIRTQKPPGWSPSLSRPPSKPFKTDPEFRTEIFRKCHQEIRILENISIKPILSMN